MFIKPKALNGKRGREREREKGGDHEMAIGEEAAIAITGAVPIRHTNPIDWVYYRYN